MIVKEKTTKEKVVKERIYECEVKRKRIIDGTRSTFWKVKTVREALEDNDVEFRCKDCHGDVKLFKRNLANVPAPHVEHKHRQDSEYCPAGVYFQAATDNREPRLSEHPVQ